MSLGVGTTSLGGTTEVSGTRFLDWVPDVLGSSTVSWGQFLISVKTLDKRKRKRKCDVFSASRHRPLLWSRWFILSSSLLYTVLFVFLQNTCPPPHPPPPGDTPPPPPSIHSSILSSTLLLFVSLLFFLFSSILLPVWSWMAANGRLVILTHTRTLSRTRSGRGSSSAETEAAAAEQTGEAQRSERIHSRSKTGQKPQNRTEPNRESCSEPTQIKTSRQEVRICCWFVRFWTLIFFF